LRYARLSPSKARDIIRHVKGLPLRDALALVEATPNKAADLLARTLRSAAANARKNFEVEEKDLKVADAFVDEGPRLKRWRARARGMPGRRVKRTSHLGVVLSDA